MKTAAVLLLALSCCAVGPAVAKTFLFLNQLTSPVWIGTLGNSGKGNPDNGGFAVDAGGQATVTTADDWAGRFWARTGCNFDESGSGTCATGDCGGHLECGGTGGTPPVTLAEFTLSGYGGMDYYDVSLVDGFNVAIQIAPQNLAVDTGYNCGRAGCLNDLDANCPSELQQFDDSGALVACKSSCLAYNTDQYCCRGNYGTSDTCHPDTWDVDSAKYFKANCPNAYSYAYDDSTSTYTCTDDTYVITVSRM